MDRPDKHSVRLRHTDTESEDEVEQARPFSLVAACCLAFFRPERRGA